MSFFLEVYTKINLPANQNQILESLTTEQQTQITDITSVVEDDTQPAVSTLVNTDNFKGMMKIDKDHNMTTVLSRPVVIKSGVLTSALQEAQCPIDSEIAVGTDLIAPLTLPLDWLGSKYIANKIQNFQYLRNSWVVRLTLNASPFMAGKILVFAAPYDLSIEADIQSSAKGLAALTSYASAVIMDLGREHTCELTIPFTSIAEYLNLQDSTDLLTLYVRFVNISALLTGNDELISYTVQVQAIDPEVAGPSYFGVTNPVRDLHCERQLQGEAAQKSKGLVTQAAGIVASVASYASNIPFLSAFSAPVTSIARGVEALADYFGWSKPPLISPPVFVLNKGTNGLSYGQGVDSSTSLALTAENKLAIENDHFTTQLDEMSFGFLCSKESYYNRFDYSESNVPGDLLYQDIVTPATHLKNSGLKWSPTPMEYIAQFFDLWRGDIEYIFDFTKTAMHNGKVLIVFSPNTDELPATGLLDAQHLLYSLQVDLAKTSIVRYRVNYMSQSPWRSCARGIATSPIGRIAVICMNKLQRPESVADHVSVLVGKCSDNMQFAVPIDTAPALLNPPGNIVPAYINVGPILLSDVKDTETRELQSNQIEGINTVNTIIRGESGIRMENAEWAVNECTGENILSLRFLLKRFFCFASLRQPTIGTFNADIANPATMARNDLVCAISRLYFFWRGGIRFKTLNVPGGPKRLTANISGNEIHAAYLRTAPVTLGANNLVPNAPTSYNDESITLGNEFSIPFYCKYRVKTVSTILNDQIDAGSRKRLILAGNFNIPVSLYRSVDDNFTFGYLVGAPMLSTATPNTFAPPVRLAPPTPPP